MKSLQTRTLLNRTLRGGGEPGGNHAEQNWAGVLGVVVALLERFAVGAGETEEATQVADQVVDGNGGKSSHKVDTDVIKDIGRATEVFGSRAVLRQGYPVACFQKEEKHDDPRSGCECAIDDHDAQPVGAHEVDENLDNSQSGQSHDRPVKVMPDRSRTQKGGGWSEDQEGRALCDAKPDKTDAECDELSDGVET